MATGFPATTGDVLSAAMFNGLVAFTLNAQTGTTYTTVLNALACCMGKAPSRLGAYGARFGSQCERCCKGRMVTSSEPDTDSKCRRSYFAIRDGCRSANACREFE